MFDRRNLAVALAPSAPARSADPRAGMLRALVRTIALRGYDRTTIDRVLLAAEVPAAVFDEHFEDKQDCLLVALDELIAEVERAISTRIDESACWSERVLTGLEALLAAFAADPDGARVALVECLSAGEEAIARVRAAIAKAVPVLEEGRHGEGGPETSAPDTAHLPAQTSEAVVGGIASILHRRVLEGRTSELPGLLPDLLYFALMPYLGHERALTVSATASARAC
ncbi:MAG TPA: TetR/AcrR family transcriptional regulator [Solirubrobacteraceae bacterium]|jgi:AcrR family transcriptional regulator